MNLEMETRAREEANFIIQNNATLRFAESCLGISRSTISRDMVRLLKIDAALARNALAVLTTNKMDSRRRANVARTLKAKNKKKK